jgi:acetylornithine/succinyldiaminopimelate/putrescine aminotransferase
MIENDDLLKNVERVSRVFRGRLSELQSQCELIQEVRVLGMMIGIELAIEGAAIVKACMEKRLLINCTHGTVLRLLPAMNLTEKQAHQGCDLIAEAIKEQGS